MNPTTTLTNNNPPATPRCGLNPSPICREESETPHRTEAHLVCAAPPGVQEELIEDDPDRFFRPPYVGGRGWIGVRLDGGVDWDEIAAILAEAHRTITG